ncbi:MAG: hypothetical protein H6Q84_2939, partial [Deltaproteobacteria bacterium]|nr:hypothetical protein [Deltaproteobacteria bacterium]
FSFSPSMAPLRNRRRSSRPLPLHGRPLDRLDTKAVFMHGAPLAPPPPEPPPQPTGPSDTGHRVTGHRGKFSTDGTYGKAWLAGQALSRTLFGLDGDTLRFIDKGTKGKSVPTKGAESPTPEGHACGSLTSCATARCRRSSPGPGPRGGRFSPAFPPAESCRSAPVHR